MILPKFDDRNLVVFYTLCIVYISCLYLNYWKEIACLLDSANYLFQIDFKKSFFTPHHRYIGVLVQYLPIIASMLKVNYKLFVFSYLVNPLFSTLILYFVYGIITQKWKNGWVFILGLVAGMKFSFYYAIPEHFGYSLGIFSILIYDDFIRRERWKALVIFSIIVGLVLGGSHFYVLGLIFVGFMYMFILSKDKLNTLKYILLQVAILIFILCIIKLILPPSGYEIERLNVLKDNLKHISHLDEAGFRHFFRGVHKHNLMSKMFYFLCLLVSIRSKKYVIALVAFIVFMITFYLNCLYSFQWGSEEYMDLYGRVIFLSILIGIYFGSVSLNIHSKLFPFIVILFLGVFTKNVTQLGSRYTDRRELLTQIVNSRSDSKLYLTQVNPLSEKFGTKWAISFEALWASKIYGGEVKTIYPEDKKNKLINELDGLIFYNQFEEIPIKNLKGTYFEALEQTEYKAI